MDQKYITDKQGNKVLPITHVDAVRDDNGNTIASIMGAYKDTVNARLDEQDDKIELLDGHEVVVVADHTQVQSPDSQKIYREQGSTSYTDWMYNGGSWKEIATYDFPSIDEGPSTKSTNLVESGGVSYMYNGLLKRCNLLDLTPDEVDKFYSSAGVLQDVPSSLVGTGFCTKEIDISLYVGKYLMFRLGWSGNNKQGCYVKRENNQYYDLSSQSTPSFDGGYYIFRIPSDSLLLQITYREWKDEGPVENRNDKYNFACISEVGSYEIMNKLEYSSDKYLTPDTFESGYWSSGGTIGTPTTTDSFNAASFNISDLKNKILKIRAAADNVSTTVPNRNNTEWSYVKFSDDTYKALKDITTVSANGFYSELFVTEDMVELEVSIRPLYKEEWFVAISGENPIARIPKTLIVVGDSTSQGAGEGSQTSVDGHISWSDHLVKKMAFNGYNKIAVNGALCMDYNSYPKLNTQILQCTDNTVITVMIGTNDIVQNVTLGDVDTVMAMNYASLNDSTNFAMAFRYNMETLIKQCPHSTIICMSPMSPLGTTLQGTGYLVPDLTLIAKVEQFIEVERKICAYLSIPFVETMKECGITPFAETALLVTSDISSSSFMADNYHPNGAGNEKIANYMESVLKKYAI